MEIECIYYLGGECMYKGSVCYMAACCGDDCEDMFIMD